MPDRILPHIVLLSVYSISIVSVILAGKNVHFYPGVIVYFTAGVNK
ncbi:hypothetical protein DCCM_2812 [Desulfocucumis palustris]|uniref:Uncharacterized protein n=1 Tax=Desulfocucumis palustris TaxID=1898651 RepID=A0A2L2XHJ6_9FIRM|nr:hypothetical protein DCCM_2812 [Desulfocucumis palustris]